MILIPAYNEEPMLGNVLKKIPKSLPGVWKIITVVVDDGSDDTTFQIAKKNHVAVLRHQINRGLGGALGTGFTYARKLNFDILVTLDADGQHLPKDIRRIIQPILEDSADIVIGSRLLARSTMPLLRKLMNIGSNIVTWAFFGVWTSDSQSGFRAFSKKAIDSIQLRTQRMEVSSEFFREIRRNNLKKAEIAIKAIYTPYSLSKGQKLSNAYGIFAKLMLRSLR